MNILISNDDGWGSPGIRILEKIARRLGNVWVVAPAAPMSGISHQMTFEVPMSLEEREPQSFTLSGTPADCTRVAMSQLDVDFDWVLSGVNHGANLGADMAVSGTVAAVREAGFLGFRGIAFSQYLDGMRSPFEWHLTEEILDRLLPKLLANPIEPGQWVNVNFPDTQGQPVQEIKFVKTVPDRNPLPSNYKQIDENKIIYCGKYKDRDCDAGSDADVCFGGGVSITHHQHWM
ncbi:UNVERIFIED_CONTAM: hypothetical protein GTU68_042842 [Idotea baltica]|nr:hypothetical protein [Idotea baltica]